MRRMPFGKRRPTFVPCRRRRKLGAIETPKQGVRVSPSKSTLLSVPPFVPAQAGSLRPGQCNRDCSRTVRPISSWARTRRYRSCACSRSRQLLGIKLDIFTLSDLIALDDICRIHLIGRFGIDLAVLDTVAGFLIELNERNLRRLAPHSAASNAMNNISVRS